MNGKEEILAPCGIDCIECLAYQATRENDYGRLAEILRDSALGDAGYEPEDLICDGCNGERVSKDSRVCWIEDCVEKREIHNYANCGEYLRDRLIQDWGSWRILSGVKARARLDKIRESPGRSSSRFGQRRGSNCPRTRVNVIS